MAASYPTSGATPKNITTSTSTPVKTGAGIFFGLSVNTAGTGSAAAVYDGLSAGGTLIGTYSTTAQGGPNITNVGLSFLVGLYVVTTDGGGAANITVTYA